jgi:hypothetical protein
VSPELQEVVDYMAATAAFFAHVAAHPAGGCDHAITHGYLMARAAELYAKHPREIHAGVELSRVLVGVAEQLVSEARRIEREQGL